MYIHYLFHGYEKNCINHESQTLILAKNNIKFFYRIMFWFVLYLVLGQIFFECFEIDKIFVLIIMKKSSELRLLILFVKGCDACADKLTNLIFIEKYFIGIIAFHLVCS